MIEFSVLFSLIFIADHSETLGDHKLANLVRDFRKIKARNI